MSLALVPSPVVKACACGRSYDRAAWEALPFVGVQGDAVEASELRNCVCKSTIAVELEPWRKWVRLASAHPMFVGEAEVELPRPVQEGIARMSLDDAEFAILQYLAMWAKTAGAESNTTRYRSARAHVDAGVTAWVAIQEARTS